MLEVTFTILALSCVAVLYAAASAHAAVPRAATSTCTVCHHAERILTSRYELGLLDEREYERALAVLRR